MDNSEHLKEFILTFIEEAKDTLELWEKTCLDLEKNPNPESIKNLFRFAHNLKGSSRSVNLNAFGTFIHKIEDLITLLRDEKIQYHSSFIALFLKCHSIMDNWCDQFENDLSYIPNEVFEIENEINQYISIIEIAKKKEIKGFSIFNYKDNAVKEESKEEKVTIAKSQQKIDTIRIPSNKIDIMIHYISELCSHHAIISHCSSIGKYNNKSFINSVQICEKIIKELQSNVFALRMLPLTSLFQRLERTAKSLAMQQNKDLEIITDGDFVELDKNIIEKIIDPLVHVIRNAVDHGIESSQERLEKNKTVKSSIKLEAKQNVSHVVITISDDGKGINPKIIFQKAVQKNLIAENTKLNEQEIYQLLFLPGFSTAEKITEVSGRGVGLDVVKQVLDEIGGYVNIQSQINFGSRFEFHLPANLSIIDVLTIKVDNLNYVIPISEISEVLDLSKIKYEKVTNSEKVALLRNNTVIIKELSQYLKNTDKNKSSLIKNAIALIVEDNNFYYAFEIDELIGIESVVFRKKSDKFNVIKYYSGSTVLPNGEPAFILSLKELINQIIIPKNKELDSNLLEGRL